MRIVLDTNVLVSALLTPHGPPARVLDLVLAGRLRMLVSDRIVDEYREVLLRPRFGFASDDVEALIAFFTDAGEWPSAAPISLSLPDPDDLPFAEAAIAGSADALVTGNRRHYPSSSMPAGLPVLTPQMLLARLGPR